MAKSLLILIFIVTVFDLSCSEKMLMGVCLVVVVVGGL